MKKPSPNAWRTVKLHKDKMQRNLLLFLCVCWRQDRNLQIQKVFLPSFLSSHLKTDCNFSLETFINLEMAPEESGSKLLFPILLLLKPRTTLSCHFSKIDVFCWTYGNQTHKPLLWVTSLSFWRTLHSLINLFPLVNLCFVEGVYPNYKLMRVEEKNSFSSLTHAPLLPTWRNRSLIFSSKKRARSKGVF